MMDMVELINTYRVRLDDDPYGCLLFALQLPSICSRIEYPPEFFSEDDQNNYYYSREMDDGSYVYRPRDKKLYKKWIMDHYDYFDNITINILNSDENVFSEALYDFRCCMTHEGISVPLDLFTIFNQDLRFCFVDVKMAPIVLNNIIYVSVVEMCECLFNVAEFVLCDIKVSACELAFLSFDEYNLILKDYVAQFDSFWDEYTADEHFLFRLYLKYYSDYSDGDDEPLAFRFFNVDRDKMELIRKKYMDFHSTLKLNSVTVNKICANKKESDR